MIESVDYRNPIGEPHERSRVPALLAASLILGGAIACDRPNVTESSAAVGESRTTTSNVSTDAFESGESDLFELATKVSSYGGHFFASDGRLTVWVVDQADAEMARQAVRALLVG